MTTRILKPAWLLEDRPIKTLHEKGRAAYREHLEKIQKQRELSYKQAQTVSRLKKKKQFEYLISIENQQGRNNWPQPYDLAKITGDGPEMLQLCRLYDHLFSYKRSFPWYEYNPNNYFKYEYPKYDKFNDFVDDNGEDYEFNDLFDDEDDYKYNVMEEYSDY